MSLTPQASAAVVLIMRVVTEFREQLALVDHGLGTMLDGLGELRIGDISDELVERMVAAQKALANLPKAADALKVIESACEIISRELGEC